MIFIELEHSTMEVPFEVSQDYFWVLSGCASATRVIMMLMPIPTKWRTSASDLLLTNRNLNVLLQGNGPLSPRTFASINTALSD